MSESQELPPDIQRKIFPDLETRQSAGPPPDGDRITRARRQELLATQVIPFIASVLPEEFRRGKGVGYYGSGTNLPIEIDGRVDLYRVYMQIRRESSIPPKERSSTMQDGY